MLKYRVYFLYFPAEAQIDRCCTWIRIKRYICRICIGMGMVQRLLAVYLHFDSIGVPGEAEMIQQYGSCMEWQKNTIFKWIARILTEYKDKKIVIFEGSFLPL